MTLRCLVIVLASALALAAAPNSCVDFDGQLVRAHHDVDRDRLDVLLVYRNLHANGPLNAGAASQLEELLEGRRWVAVMDNWPWMFHLDRALEDDERADDGPAVAALFSALDEHMEVQPGRFWVDADDGLCAWQLMRIRRLSVVTTAIDAAMRSAFLEEDGEELREMFEEWGVEGDEAAAGARRKLQAGWRLLSWDGQSLVMRMPAKEPDWTALKRTLLEEALRYAQEAGKEAEDDPLVKARMRLEIELLARNDWDLSWDRGAVEARIGRAGATELSIETPPRGQAQEQSLREALDSRGVAVSTDDLEPLAIEAWEAWRREP
jgi:hypothetical protein